MFENICFDKKFFYLLLHILHNNQYLRMCNDILVSYITILCSHELHTF